MKKTEKNLSAEYTVLHCKKKHKIKLAKDLFLIVPKEVTLRDSYEIKEICNKRGNVVGYPGKRTIEMKVCEYKRHPDKIFYYIYSLI